MVSFASRIISSNNREIPKSLMGITIDPRIREFREDIIDDPEKRLALREELKAKEAEAQKELGQFAPEDLKDVDIATVEGISARDKNIKAVKLENFDISMEDADTLTLKPKGLFGGKNIDIRLAGIDAPEVAQHENDPLEDIRINADQPYGKEAAAAFRALLDNQDNKELLVDMGRQSYGRYLGAIIGDEGRNLNIEAVRQGIATALPFGPEEEDLISRAQASTAQRQAISEKKGLWQYARYQAIATSWEAIGRPVTHNTLTRIDKAAENLNLGAYISYLGDIGSEKRDLTSLERQTSARLGYALRKTHGPPKTGFNKFDGMQEGGMAAQMRHQNTDFGSGFIGAMFGSTSKFLGTSRSGLKTGFSGWLKSSKIGVFKAPEGMSTRSIWARAINPFKTGPKVLEPGVYLSQKVSPQERLLHLFHEGSEQYWRKRGAIGKFGGHTAPQVIVEEAFMSAKLGPEYFQKMKTLRMAEIKGSSTVYAERVRKIYSSFETKWLPRISGKDDAYNTISGLNENGIAARMRKLFGFGSGRIRGFFSKLLGSSKGKVSLARRSSDLKIAEVAHEFSISAKDLPYVSTKRVVGSHHNYLDEAKARLENSRNFSVNLRDIGELAKQPVANQAAILDRFNQIDSYIKNCPMSDTPLLSEMPTRNIRGKLQAGASSANGQIKTNFRAMPGRNHSK